MVFQLMVDDHPLPLEYTLCFDHMIDLLDPFIHFGAGIRRDTS